MTASALPAGLILTHPRASLPPSGKFLLVSLARSGDSPESGAVVERLLQEERATQLLITCNRDGALAVRFGSKPRVESIVLPPETNDQSLVMTSSFTNLVLAARSLAGRGRAISRERGEALRRGPHSSRGARGRPRDPCAPPVLRGRLPGERPPAGRRSRIGAQDAGIQRRPRAHDGRILPRAAPRSHGRGRRGQPHRRVSLIRPGRPRVRAGRPRWSSSARVSAGGASSSANAFLRTSPGNPRTSGST